MQYRRVKIEGGTYFFTVNLAERKRTILLDNVQILREVISRVKERHPFVIDAMVVLPDHLHAIWTLPRNDADYSTRWMLIKAGFSRRINRGERRNASRIKKGERGIWQRRYWEHLIHDDGDYKRHADYIHYNPVKHGYVIKPTDWPYSSIHRYIEAGIIDRDWGQGKSGDRDNSYGER
jgi:putative transposase